MSDNQSSYSSGSISIGGDVKLGDKITFNVVGGESKVVHISQKMSASMLSPDPEIQKLIEQLRAAISTDERLPWEDKARLAEIVENIRYEFSTPSPDMARLREMIKGTLIPSVGEQHPSIVKAAKDVWNCALGKEQM